MRVLATLPDDAARTLVLDAYRAEIAAALEAGEADPQLRRRVAARLGWSERSLSRRVAALGLLGAVAEMKAAAGLPPLASTRKPVG